VSEAPVMLPLETRGLRWVFNESEVSFACEQSLALRLVLASEEDLERDFALVPLAHARAARDLVLAHRKLLSLCRRADVLALARACAEGGACAEA
jgi:hypothetical protein